MNIPLTELGDYAIIKYTEPFIGVVGFPTHSEVITGETNMVQVKRQIRYSTNGRDFSAWIDISKFEQIEFPPNASIYVEMKLERVGINQDTTVEVTDFGVIPKFIEEETSQEIAKSRMPTIECIECVTGGYYDSNPAQFCLNDAVFGRGLTDGVFDNEEDCSGWNPYDVQTQVDEWQELNQRISNLYGIDVTYFKTVPEFESSDCVLKEYGIYNVPNDLTKCIKIMVEGNEFPDSKFQFNPFGMDYEPDFEILIDYRSWHKVYGDREPQKRDFLKIEINSRLYEVTSTYLFRSFMQAPAWYKLNLVKYQDKVNVVKTDSIDEFLDEQTIQTDEVILPERNEEVVDVTNPQQNEIETLSNPTKRIAVEKQLEISDEYLMNNYTVVSENAYLMGSVYNQFQPFVAAVEYDKTAKLTEDENFVFTCWFKPNDMDLKNNQFEGKYIKNLFYDAQAKKVFVEFTLPHRFETGSYVHFQGLGNDLNGFYRVVKESGSQISIEWYSGSPNVPNFNQKTKVVQIHPIVLIDGYEPNTKQGIRIELIQRKILRVITNSVKKDYALGFELPQDDNWFALVVQILNRSNQLDMRLWRRTSYTSISTEQQTTLDVAWEYTDETPKIHFDLDMPYALIGSPVTLTNIRLLKKDIRKEKQSVILNLQQFKDSSQAWILDNARPPLNFAKIGRNH